MIGTTLSHYKVLEKIGEGGMGVVYRATDTKLNRDVALKILPEQFASDSQRMGRFQREAEVLASLDHPNIGQIYGIEEAGETKALVLQLIEGPTLAERIAQGPIPVEEALKIALQMAEGLEAAHEKGVIHRDLKPANIKITPEGQVKILDFGLAKALEGEVAESSLSQSPTLTNAATQAGVILGTAAYMSPEQARGHTVDKRADIWAFGCVLFEMLTGRQAFPGSDVTDILAAVIRAEPEWDRLPRDVHPGLRILLVRCLEKELRQRKQSIADVRAELEISPTQAEAEMQATSDQGGSRSWARPVAAAALTAALASVITGLVLWDADPSISRTLRFPVPLPAEQQPGDNTASVAISPNGQSIVTVGPNQLYLRNVDGIEARPVPGTEGASGAFFSPDSRWIGFFANGSVHKALVDGGAPQRIGRVPGILAGASWGPDNVIVIGGSLDGLVIIAADPGSVQSPLTTDGTAFTNERHHSPHILPDGRHIVFMLEKGQNSYVAVASLETGDYWQLFPGGTPRYLATGHLVYEDAGNLMAVPFDPVALKPSGDPGLVLEGVFSFRWAGSNISYYAISDEGTLVYVPGGEVEFLQTTRLVWVDRSGTTRSIGGDVNDHYYPRLHPSGERLAVSRQDEAGRNFYLYDVNRPNPERFTSEGVNFVSAWSPLGDRLFYQGLFWKALDSIDSQRLPVEANLGWVGSVSSDGRYLAYTDVEPATSGDIWIVDLDDPGPPTGFAHSPDNERAPWFSPDGRAIAYVSGSSSGDMEVYVAPFPGPGRPLSVSTGGGTEPVWAPNGELFYWQGNTLFAVEMETNPELRILGEQALFQDSSFMRTNTRLPNYDIAADAKEFVMVQRIGESQVDQLNIVLNWFEELKERVPVP